MRLKAEYFLIVMGFGLAVLAYVQLGKLAAAAVYAGVFLMTAMWDPKIALMLIFASAPFQMDLSGGGPVRFSIAEVNLALAFPVFLLHTFSRKGRLSLGPITIPVILYLSICLFSSLLFWRGKTALISILQMIQYVVVAVMVFSLFLKKEEDHLFVLKGLLFTSVILAIMVITSTNGALGLHKNGIGRSLASAFIICAELWFAAHPRKRMWPFLTLIIITGGLLFSVSRGAWLGALFGLFFVLASRRKIKFLFSLCLVMVPLVAFGWRFMPEETREYAVRVDPEAYSIKERLATIEMAKSIISESPLYGIGVGFRKEFDAINVILSTLAETGIIGLLAFLSIFLAFFRMVWKMQKIIPQKDSLYSLLVIGGALVLCGLAHGMVDHYWSRGGSMIAWAGAGMSLAAYFAVRRRLRALKAAR